ncbi:MAG: ATP-binding cassette domain-containing protein [Candidatus Eremiobacteraeota bacterium]|nr:ATP-binding cassette domain-containing protein [Candidatus Eremiobacteraeota bacterium]
MAGTILLEVKDLKKHYTRGGGFLSSSARETVKALDGVSFSLEEGETLGLVGESGCGKTTLGRLVLRLIEPSGGAILYRGIDMAGLSPRRMRALRKELQIIFQDPYSSLDPRMNIRTIIEEPLAINGMERRERGERVKELLDWVGLPEECLRRYPHEFSGGQRQRIGIARALSLSPRMVVADEPVSALDVSIQAQIVNLLLDLQARLSLSYLFISHDISVVRYVSRRIAVMYLGRIVELGSAVQVCESAAHPYTKLLLASVPDMLSKSQAPQESGDVPNPVHPPGGCHFHPRCALAADICRLREPEDFDVEEGHSAACHLLAPGRER